MSGRQRARPTHPIANGLRIRSSNGVKLLVQGFLRAEIVTPPITNSKQGLIPIMGVHYNDQCTHTRCYFGWRAFDMELMTTDYLQKILNARVYDVAVESPLDLA